MVDNPLPIQFGSNLALIWCDDEALRQSLSQYFRHCLPSEEGPAATVVTYQITRTKDQAWQLRCDGKLVYPGPTPYYIFMHLTRDVVAKLVTRSQQHTVFHAAGLARGETGLILCGQSESGKSTLAAWLTATGFDFLTDELAAVALDGREMIGLTCPIVLKPNSAFVWQHWLAQETDENLIHFFNGVAWVDPELLRPDCVCAAAIPRILIFPRYTAGGEPVVAQPLSPAEAAFRLMPRLVNFANLPNRGLAEITRLAQQMAAYQLSYADVASAATWVEQMVVELSSSSEGVENQN